MFGVIFAFLFFGEWLSLARASLREGRWFKRGQFVYFVYILQSLKTGRLYIGHTNNLDRRVEEHNTGRGGKYTRQNGPWKLVYNESSADRPSAVKRELYLKSTRGSRDKKRLAGISN